MGISGLGLLQKSMSYQHSWNLFRPYPSLTELSMVEEIVRFGRLHLAVPSAMLMRMPLTKEIACDVRCRAKDAFISIVVRRQWDPYKRMRYQRRLVSSQERTEFVNIMPSSHSTIEERASR